MLSGFFFLWALRTDRLRSGSQKLSWRANTIQGPVEYIYISYHTYSPSFTYKRPLPLTKRAGVNLILATGIPCLPEIGENKTLIGI
jgi:hypothetical protein